MHVAGTAFSTRWHRAPAELEPTRPIQRCRGFMTARFRFRIADAVTTAATWLCAEWRRPLLHFVRRPVDIAQLPEDGSPSERNVPICEPPTSGCPSYTLVCGHTLHVRCLHVTVTLSGWEKPRPHRRF